ncbi:metallophosphoesterase family protein [Novosphingopyxis iocasae]|uniref:metallophosphoesterase family protein n=1 Tax=Novosphingopyxis iocasae TaxID=2762729 RepID=UPI001650FDCB|nr:metallophosphoesterase family protein [Novosphingopyxis iocasae]
MVLRLLKRKKDVVGPRGRKASIPEGERVYAIGDIHGRADLFDALLAKIEADDTARGNAETTLILLGDLVDRGPDSRGVVERAMKLGATRGNVRFLAGNHEEVFLEAVRSPSKEVARFFYRIGGRETVMSYGLSEEEMNALDHAELAQRIPQVVPEEHAAFIEAFEDSIAIGDYLFVHAGVKPDVPLDSQKARHLRWIREEFLDHKGRLDKLVVHGHTISEEVEERGHRIGIDTGAWESGKLTAIGLEGTERWFIDTAE